MTKGLLEIEINGVTVFAVAINYVGEHHLVCYAQNRLFTVYESDNGTQYFDNILVEYCIIPEYDTILEEYSTIEG